uniref:E4 protein n=1 Tax=Human papillomavirus TaxID=10566 RepID=A0A385PIW4_9PAPI|nr:MAG: E4 protein [Human papillomavirus]
MTHKKLSHTQIGSGYIIKTNLMSGTKLKGKLIIMVYILKSIMVIELILLYLTLMQPNMDSQDNGL